jgi:hypothetical protein
VNDENKKKMEKTHLNQNELLQKRSSIHGDSSRASIRITKKIKSPMINQPKNMKISSKSSTFQSVQRNTIKTNPMTIIEESSHYDPEKSKNMEENIFQEQSESSTRFANEFDKKEDKQNQHLEMKIVRNNNVHTSNPSRFNHDEKLKEDIDKYNRYKEKIKEFDEERERLKQHFPSKECLPKIKRKKNNNIDHFNEMNKLKDFWIKFAEGSTINKRDIKSLSWKARIIFESYLKRKEFGEDIKWNIDYINKIKNKTILKRGDDNIKYILKVCFSMLHKDYKKTHFTYREKLENDKTFMSLKKKEKEFYGFLHKYFWETKVKLDIDLFEFDLTESNMKDQKKLRKYVGLIFQSKKFSQEIDKLIDENVIKSNRGIIPEFCNQLKRKINTKFTTYLNIYNKFVVKKTFQEYFEWTKKICNDLEFNPKCKLPWAYIDLKRAIDEFGDFREEAFKDFQENHIDSNNQKNDKN